MADCAVRIILGYGPQESEKAEIREDFFNELDVEVTKCKIAADLPIVIGDMNAKLNTGENKTQHHESPNGKLLMDLTTNQELKILNFHDKCQGKWTHVIRTTGATSILDYVMTCQEVEKHVSQVCINEDYMFCPFRIRKRKGVTKPKYSDHNPIIVHMRIPHQKKKIKRPERWKLTKEGLENFKEITTRLFDAQLPAGNTQEVYDQVEMRINRAMSECFRKVKVKKHQEIASAYLEKYKAITLFARKGKIQRRIAKIYIQELIRINTAAVAAASQAKVKDTLQRLTIDNKFSPNNFWELCKKTRVNSSNVSSIETADGIELYGDEIISDAYLKEFVYRLRKRDIIPELKHYQSVIIFPIGQLSHLG